MPKKLPEDVRSRFLEAIAAGDTIRAAAAAVGVTPQATDYWRKEPEFAEAFVAATEIGVQALEQEAKRRAVEGTDKPVYQGGQLVGHVRDYSDTLLIFLLKAKRPAVYRDNVKHEHEVAGPGGGPIPVASYDYHAAISALAPAEAEA